MLRGVGLGNWLLPEGYMWKFGKEADRPRTIEKLIRDLLGPEGAARFWSEYRREYITQADIQKIAAVGFNSVRAVLNARLLLTEGVNPTYRPEGFELLENLVGWCKEAGVYVIIDMHAAPGGQTGANIDDSADDQPRLFMDSKNQDLLVNLWVKIATQYKDEPAVAAYDLLNEPLPERTGAAAKFKQDLEPLYRRITAAIRKVDKRHTITIEGADWANEWSVFTGPFDDNLVYQFHYYCWDRPARLKGINQYLDYRKRFGTPIWAGETGERDDAIYWATTDYFEANNVGWSFWPWKKLDARNAPYSIKAPDNWETVTASSRPGAATPSKETAQKAFDGLLKNIRLENCVYYPDVVNALFRRVPGKIEAENYGHEGPGKSYFVKDPSQKARNYRASEPVPVEEIDGGGRRRQSGQGIRLGPDEWAGYMANSQQGRAFQVTVRVRAERLPASFDLLVNGKAQKVNVEGNDWVELKLEPVDLLDGANRLKLQVTRGVVCFDWLGLE